MQRRFSATEINKLADHIRRLPPVSRGTLTGTPDDNPALKVVACVFSLNRNYEKQVKPLLDQFRKQYPRVDTLEGLMSEIDGFGDCRSFFARLLGYREDAKSDTLYGVLYYFIEISKQFSGSPMQRLESWATAVKPQDYRRMIRYKGLDIHVPGFGPAGWQYMRMLCGADTCKPDTHIMQFICDVIGRNVAPLAAVEALELAAPVAGLSVRESDFRIWHKYSTTSRTRRRRRKPPQCQDAGG